MIINPEVRRSNRFAAGEPKVSVRGMKYSVELTVDLLKPELVLQNIDYATLVESSSCVDGLDQVSHVLLEI